MLPDAQLAEMRAMAREASLDNGNGKHNDPAYYSRNLAKLLEMALDEIDAHRLDAAEFARMAESELTRLQSEVARLQGATS